MTLNDVGQLIEATWASLPKRFPSIELDDFIVMPNHVHGIIYLNARPEAPTLGAVIGAFKSLSAVGANRLLGRSGRPLWQRNYYEHIVRDQPSLDEIRQYIALNPARWAFDRENPEAI